MIMKGFSKGKPFFVLVIPIKTLFTIRFVGFLKFIFFQRTIWLKIKNGLQIQG